MANLTLTLPDGRVGTATVDDHFATLSPDDQASIVNDIAQQVGHHFTTPSSAPPAAGPVTHAVSADGVVHEFPAGTDQSVIDRVMKTYAASQTAVGNLSFTSDLQGGLHDLGTAASQGLKTVGGVMSRNGMPQWGGDISSAGDAVAGVTPSDPQPDPASSQIADAVRQGRVSDIPGLLPHAVVRGAGSVLPILAGGVVGGPVGAGIAAGAMAYGPAAYARAANNGRSEPDTTDAGWALPDAATQGVIGSALPGGAADVITSAGLRAAARAGIMGAANAGMDVANQVGTTLGTDKGLSVDPAQVAASAITGTAMGAARELPTAARDAVAAGSDQIMARTLEPPKSPEEAASVLRVNALMDTAQTTASNTTGAPISDTVAANVVKSNLAGQIDDGVRQLAALGMIDNVQLSSLRRQIQAEALRHNNVASQSLFDRIDDLDNVPEATRTALQSAVMDLNTVASQSFIANTVGPMQRIGSVVGKGAAIVGGIHLGSPEAIVGGFAGKGLAGNVGGAVGALGDRVLGTNTPTVRLQAINAGRVLRAAGIDPATATQGPSISDTLSGIEPPQAAPRPAPPAPGMGIINQMQAQSAGQTPQPAPAPGFIRPTPQPFPDQQPSATPAPPVPGLALMRAQQAMSATRPQPDPVTGNLPDAVPVNTPISPSRGGSLPPLRIDTPADVRTALAAADKVMGNTPPQVPPTGPLVPPATHLPGTAYIASGDPRITPAVAVQGAQNAELAGHVPPGTAASVATSTAPINPQIAKLIQPHAQAIADQMFPLPDVVQAAQARGKYAVDVSEQARVNAREFQANARAYAASHPEVSDEVLAMAQTSSPAAKRAMAAAYVAAHPEAAGKFPEWLLSHGRKD